MLRISTNKQLIKEALFLSVLTSLCFLLIAGRIHLSDSKMFLFLVWNLFLAGIPWVITSFIMLNEKLQKNKLALTFMLTAWVLFFPNAPYILTDLFHLKTASSMPIWFDLILILSFAWTGLIFGFLSLRDIEFILKKDVSKAWGNLIITSLLFLSAFGIYLGRYLRWNSWDILDHPLGIITDIGQRVINPFEHPRTWGMTLLMGVLLNMFYWSFRLLQKEKTNIK